MFKGNITQLCHKSLLISDRLAYFKSNHPDFKYTIKFTIGKESSLKVCTDKEK